MEFNEFIEKTKNSICRFLGDLGSAETKEVIKNNGVILHGIIITGAGEAISPTIYLDAFYEEYRRGKPFGSIVHEIIKIYEENKVSHEINLDFFMDYNAVRGRIFQKVIHYDKNRKLLHNLPHKRFLDLAVVCYYAYMNDFLGRGSIQIEIGHLDKWGISEEELFADARENTLKKLGAEVRSMDEILLEMMEEQLETADTRQLKNMLDNRTEQEIPMYIMTLRGRYFGAACICFEEMLKSFSDRCGKSFYILPSSVHELILIPESGREEPETLKNMVREINADHVLLEEQLSDNIYYFDISKNEVSLI
ncbi:MAG: DUF5688 family protein [Lachnospiraceae bacterium]|nr:DUF5688 family protein [Lachnospiraceae bacterium]